MGTYASRNPLAATNPLRSCQWGKPAALVMHRPSVSYAYETDIRLARYDLAAWERTYELARAHLGNANRLPPATRRIAQSCAMRHLNAVRKGLRAALRRIVAAEVALAALATAPA